MSKTGSDGAKDVFFSHENIVRKIIPVDDNYVCIVNIDRYMLDHPCMFTQ
jgi:hypothetical protein